CATAGLGGNELRVELTDRPDENQRRESAQRQARGQSPEHPVHAWRLILTARYNPFSKVGLMAASKSYSLTGWVLIAFLGAVSPALAQSSIGFVSLERILRGAPAAPRATKKVAPSLA